jgi:hypothetical protein
VYSFVELIEKLPATRVAVPPCSREPAWVNKSTSCMRPAATNLGTPETNPMFQDEFFISLPRANFSVIRVFLEMSALLPNEIALPWWPSRGTVRLGMS